MNIDEKIKVLESEGFKVEKLNAGNCYAVSKLDNHDGHTIFLKTGPIDAIFSKISDIRAKRLMVADKLGISAEEFADVVKNIYVLPK